MISPRLAAWGDRLCLALLGLTLVVEFVGGIRLGEGAYRFTMTSAWRIALYTVALVVIRHLVVPHPSLRERLIARRRARSAASWPGERLWLPTRREWLVAALLLGVATAWMLRTQIRHLNGVPDMGDPLFSMWRLSTIADRLAHDPWNLFDGNMFYPTENTLAYSDAILLPGLIAAPVIWAGVPVAYGYGALCVLSFWTAGLGMFLAVRTLTGSFTAALFAAILFAFYPYRFSSYSHLEKLGTAFMPVAFLLLWRVLQHGRRAESAALGLTMAAQALWSLYLGAFLAVGLAAVTVTRWAAGHFSWRERGKSLLIATTVVAVIVGPYTLPYWVARQVVGERDRAGVRIWSAQRADLFTVTSKNRLHSKWLSEGENGERHLFPGLAALGLTAVALTPPFSPLAGAAAAGLLVSVDGALGLNGVTFTWLFDTVPPFRAFRAPGRFSAVVGLFVCLLAGLGLARWLGRRPSQLRQVGAYALIGVAFFELQADLRLAPTAVTPPAIYSALPDEESVVLVNLPVPSEYNAFDFQYIYHSTFHRRRLINGSSGFIPEDYTAIKEASDTFPAETSLEVLRRRGATHVVLHGDFYDGSELARDVASLEGRPDVTLVATRASPEGRIDRLYRLR